MLTKSQVSKYLAADFVEGTLSWVYHDQRPDLVGKVAGCVNNGYRRLSVCGIEVYAYQVIWLMFYGEWPAFTIDHIDMDTLNDSIFNLRIASKAQNTANSVMNRLNTSGLRGVSFCRSTGKWRASIQIDGISKNLGRYSTPEEAHSVYLAAATKARGEEFVRA